MFRSPGYNDAQDVRQVLGGNRQAFEGLVRRYEGAVRGVALAEMGKNYIEAARVGGYGFRRILLGHLPRLPPGGGCCAGGVSACLPGSAKAAEARGLWALAHPDHAQRRD